MVNPRVGPRPTLTHCFKPSSASARFTIHTSPVTTTRTTMNLEEFRGYCKLGQLKHDEAKLEEFPVSIKRTLIPLLIEARYNRAEKRQKTAAEQAEDFYNQLMSPEERRLSLLAMSKQEP
mmetsp:Transcript_18954/g.31628  ORF Transcript_18954/g.31628 Transcript_18954/m.31628 type:complete len:120 (+) Transcript_18954:49-408(+)